LISDLCGVADLPTMNRSSSGLECKHPTAFLLMRSANPPLAAKQTRCPKWAMIWDTHRAAVGLGQLGSRLLKAVDQGAPLLGHSLSPHTHELAHVMVELQKKLAAVVEDVEKQEYVSDITLQLLLRAQGQAGMALRKRRPIPQTRWRRRCTMRSTASTAGWASAAST
jgi:hypothetical protein